MEFNFAPLRLLFFGACIGAFALLGGFTPPNVDRDGLHDATRVRKAWSYCVIAFIVGAGCVSLVDHTTGNFEPTSLRPAYIVLGLLLMGTALVWSRSLKTATEKSPEHAMQFIEINDVDSSSPDRKIVREVPIVDFYLESRQKAACIMDLSPC